jgi:hypothetical protein
MAQSREEEKLRQIVQRTAEQLIDIGATHGGAEKLQPQDAAERSREYRQVHNLIQLTGSYCMCLNCIPFLFTDQSVILLLYAFFINLYSCFADCNPYSQVIQSSIVEKKTRPSSCILPRPSQASLPRSPSLALNQNDVDLVSHSKIFNYCSVNQLLLYCRITYIVLTFY